MLENKFIEGLQKQKNEGAKYFGSSSACKITWIKGD